MRTGPRLMGSPRHRDARSFPRPRSILLVPPSSRGRFVFEIILPYARLLFRVPSFQRLARIPFGTRALPALGFLPSSRPHPCASTIARPSTTALAFRPQVFSTSRRLAPRTGSQACFIPLPRPGFSCSRPSLSAQPTFPRREEPAPLALTVAHSPTEIGCHVRRPRLRGFDPREGAFRRFGYSPLRGRCLLQVSLLQVIISHRWPRLLEAIRP